jgi:hypothetical protein
MSLKELFEEELSSEKNCLWQEFSSGRIVFGKNYSWEELVLGRIFGEELSEEEYTWKN